MRRKMSYICGLVMSLAVGLIAGCGEKNNEAVVLEDVAIEDEAIVEATEEDEEIKRLDHLMVSDLDTDSIQPLGQLYDSEVEDGLSDGTYPLVYVADSYTDQEAVKTISADVLIFNYYSVVDIVNMEVGNTIDVGSEKDIEITSVEPMSDEAGNPFMMLAYDDDMNEMQVYSDIFVNGEGATGGFELEYVADYNAYVAVSDHGEPLKTSIGKTTIELSDVMVLKDIYNQKLDVSNGNEKDAGEYEYNEIEDIISVLESEKDITFMGIISEGKLTYIVTDWDGI